MTPDEVVKELKRSIEKYCSCKTCTIIPSAIAFIQDYQKLRGKIDVEKIANILYNADKNISGVTEPKQEYMIDAQIIVKYLQQPTEH